jgi:hypothetical protein
VASRLLTEADIRARVGQAWAEAGLSRDEVLRALKTIGTATLDEVATYDPTHGLILKPNALEHPAPESVERCFDTEGRGRIKITLESKVQALTLIAKILRLMEPDQASLAERVTLVIVRPTKPTPKGLGSGRRA